VAQFSSVVNINTWQAFRHINNPIMDIDGMLDIKIEFANLHSIDPSGVLVSPTFFRQIVVLQGIGLSRQGNGQNLLREQIVHSVPVFHARHRETPGPDWPYEFEHLQLKVLKKDFLKLD
jgi:hypothetical protein